ncbi:hypothetical protein [Pseudomonas viridiflava]|uniref:Uncharacterized protein n=1 Tax=Pseudomonas viridiflava TaxID=33069 RepID=A0AA46ZUL2_PSEVI|nr:hypothetical protein [Pseudomonas viridiflava]UZA70931.1 hypothetical protein EZZ81_22945 [Pseudomonas viridiflava]
MNICIIQLHGVESVEDANMYAEFALELYDNAYDIVISIQSSPVVYEELIAGWRTNDNIIYVGEQRRTLEEWLLYYAFSGIQPVVLYDAVAEAEIELSTRFDAELCYRLKIEFEKCTQLPSMSNGVMSQIESASALVAGISRRAEKLCFILSERLDSFCALVRAENSLARGLVSWTVNKISSVGHLDCGAVNMFEAVLEEYRVLGKQGKYKSDFIEDRKNLLLALSSSKAASHDSLALSKYLLVQSAYSFSLSKVYLSLESNLAALFAFRSFEFLLLSILIGSGKVIPVFNGRILSYELNGKQVSGVKDLWGALKLNLVLLESTSQGLSSFITVRNKSYLGHGFFHSSKDMVDFVLNCLIEIVNSGLSEELRGYWMVYKRCSRGLRVKDGFDEDLLTLSL